MTAPQIYIKVDKEIQKIYKQNNDFFNTEQNITPHGLRHKKCFTTFAGLGRS